MSSGKDGLQTFGILMVLRVAYQFLLRPILLKAVDDPNEAWDDTLMEIVDRLFNYQKEQ